MNIIGGTCTTLPREPTAHFIRINRYPSGFGRRATLASQPSTASSSQGSASISEWPSTLSAQKVACGAIAQKAAGYCDAAKH
ncbi:hypothetical protein [Burkholderia cepacia]|uniref:hypothetical protein n=1 Tax=Burkholderia cepacia TaxID=292 RepID=UPI0015889A53|nr:hypothetical protein [Burkholderia cepacia]